MRDKREPRLDRDDIIWIVEIALCAVVAIGFIAFGCWVAWLDHRPTLAQPVDAKIETHGGTDYVVLDHDGEHYVIELGSTQ